MSPRLRSASMLAACHTDLRSNSWRVFDPSTKPAKHIETHWRKGHVTVLDLYADADFTAEDLPDALILRRLPPHA